MLISSRSPNIDCYLNFKFSHFVSTEEYGHHILYISFIITQTFKRHRGLVSRFLLHPSWLWMNVRASSPYTLP